MDRTVPLSFRSPTKVCDTCRFSFDSFESRNVNGLMKVVCCLAQQSGYVASEKKIIAPNSVNTVHRFGCCDLWEAVPKLEIKKPSKKKGKKRNGNTN